MSAELKFDAVTVFLAMTGKNVGDRQGPNATTLTAQWNLGYSFLKV